MKINLPNRPRVNRSKTDHSDLVGNLAGAADQGRSPAPGSSPDGADGEFTRSIRSFVTDGSLARLCDEMTRLTSVPIWLCDVDGSVIAPREAGPGERTWEALTPEQGRARAYELVGQTPPARADLFLAPLHTSLGQIGSVAMPADWERADPKARRALERAVLLIGVAACESIEGVITLRKRVDELDTLYRLSSTLARAHDADAVLTLALDLALEALGADAGSISMLDEKTGELVHRATRGLSKAWLEDATPLSIDGLLRSKALEGEVVCVEDLLHDDRIVDPTRPRAERLSGLITTGLIYQGRAAGLIRLYCRAPRTFAQNERDLLRSIADHAAMVVALQRLRQLRDQEQQTQRQLRLAADVQRRMMPRNMPKYDRLDLAAKYAPSFQLGGDFYDVFEKGGPNRELGLAVGDVVGKGVPAAILMSAARASLRAFAGEEWRLEEVIRKLNQAVVRDTLESEFLTLWCGVIDPAKLELTYCSAGHEPSMLFRDDGTGEPAVTMLETGGMVVGVDPEQVYDVAKVSLKSGDAIVLYTDGLSEALSYEGEAFGKHRIRKTIVDLLKAQPSVSASEIIERLMWTLRQFCGIRMGGDDITMVVLRVK